jgi:Pyruvate/2-oxoglutarate dehydrogenase complex, dehydrogenase (E1) component, eukaryotic type, alpha subunit
MSAPTGVQELDSDRLIWMYTQMLRIREFEERVKRTFVEHPGVIRGHTHLADGAEASIVGSIATLGPQDQFFATYRCHGYPLARGTDPKAMMAEIYGRRDGLCRGIGGSMHLADPSTGFMGTSGIVAAGSRTRPARRGGADPQAGPGGAVLLRRRRVEAGCILRVAEHRLALEAADRVRDGEQRLQRAHAHGAGGREPRGR